jgi:hypothetical protein
LIAKYFQIIIDLGARHAVPLRLIIQFLSLIRRTNPDGRDFVVQGQGDGSHPDLANTIIGVICLASQGAVCDEIVKFKILWESEMAKALRVF